MSSLTSVCSSYNREPADVFSRDAMQARHMPSSSVCLSVRPSVTFVNSVITNKDIFKNFSASGSDTVLVFPYQTMAIFRQGPRNEVMGWDCSMFCTIEANYWQTRSIARPLCGGRATCFLLQPDQRLAHTHGNWWHCFLHLVNTNSVSHKNFGHLISQPHRTFTKKNKNATVEITESNF